MNSRTKTILLVLGFAAWLFISACLHAVDVATDRTAVILQEMGE